MLASSTARAGIWTMHPEFGANLDYSTNPQLETVASSGYDAVVSLGLPAGWDDDANHVEVAPRLKLAQAGGTSPTGADAYSVYGTATRQGELSQWNGTASWVDDSLARGVVSSGTLTRQDVRRRQTDFGLTWTEVIMPRLQSAASLSWETLRYQALFGSQLQDYRYYGGSEQLTWTLTPRLQLLGTFGGNHYERLNEVLSQNTYNAQLGFAGQWTELWSYSVTYGRSRVSAAGSGPAATGSVYAGSLQRKTERLTLSASATQSIQPSGFGFLTTVSEQTAVAGWQSSDRLGTSLTYRNVRSRDAFLVFSVDDRAYQALEWAGSWQWTEAWTLTGSVGWQKQTLHSFGVPAEGQGYSAAIGINRRFGTVKFVR